VIGSFVLCIFLLTTDREKLTASASKYESFQKRTSPYRTAMHELENILRKPFIRNMTLPY